MKTFTWSAVALLLVWPVAQAATGTSTAAQSAAADSLFAQAPAEIASPAPERSAQPFLAVDARGRVWMSWLESRAEGGHRFRAARWQNDRWAPAVTIADGTNFFANWADVPSIFVTSTGTLAAHWLARGSGRGTYDYGVRVSTSADDGRTWTAADTPHKDGTPTEHGFVSFFEAPRGQVGLIWLDGRATAGHSAGGGGAAAPAAATAAGHGGGAMTLRSTLLANGKAGAELLVDERVCDCCPTSAARTADGVVVAYRDRSEREIRDIAVSRFANGAWSKPAIVHDDGWEINGCPVNGPSIASSGRGVSVAWFTSAGGTPRVRVAFSTDGGATFARALDVPSPATLGRAAATMIDPSRALVSSLDRLPDGVALTLREVRADGRIGAAERVAPMSAERSSGFARMAVTGRRVLFAYTDAPRGGVPRVKVVVATLK